MCGWQVDHYIAQLSWAYVFVTIVEVYFLTFLYVNLIGWKDSFFTKIMLTEENWFSFHVSSQFYK